MYKLEISTPWDLKKSLDALFTLDELKGKTFDQIIQSVVNRDWYGENKQIQRELKAEMECPEGYTLGINVNPPNPPTRHRPTDLRCL